MRRPSPWAIATALGVAAIVGVYFVGVGVGEGRAKLRVETRTVERVVRNTAEEERLRRELAEVTARKNHIETVEVVREVPGGERVITRTIRDTSTEDTKKNAVEVREVVKVERVAVDRLVTVTRAAPKWGAALLGGVSAATLRPVVGVGVEYRWMRMQLQADPARWSRPTVLIGVGVHW